MNIEQLKTTFAGLRRNATFLSIKEYANTSGEIANFAIAHQCEFPCSPGVLAAFIEVYEARNLPVVPNLLRCILAISSIWNYTVERVLATNREQNPHWGRYEKDVEKLLLLL